MAMGFLAVPGIALGLDDPQSAPGWAWISSLALARHLRRLSGLGDRDGPPRRRAAGRDPVTADRDGAGMTDPWLILLRIAHVGSAMAWFGGALVGGFFLFRAAEALGPASQPFMDQLMRRQRMGVYFPIIAGLAVLSGGALFWRDSAGLSSAWISSPTGLAYAVGGLAAITAFVGGMILIGPSVRDQAAVRNELAASGGAPTVMQRERLERADRRMQLASRIDLPLLLLAGLTMAVGRYL